MADNNDLRALADAHGIQVDYWSAAGVHVTLPDATLIALLTALDVPAATPDDVADSLRELAEHRPALPPTIVATQGHSWRLPPGITDAVVALEDGGSLAVDGELPADLPLGWHVLRARAADGSDVTATIIAAPARMPDPPRGWGWQVQLYALRSARSWGIGDAADLRMFAERTAREHGADAILVNPFHSPTPVSPLQDSPYYPSSRRWYDPLLIAVEDTIEYADAAPDVRAHVDALAERARALNTVGAVDRDAVWALKREALEALFATAADADLAAYRERSGEELERYATFCALAEVNGPNWQQWPDELRSPDSREAIDARAALADRVAFFAWTQSVLAQQLPAVQAAAVAAGMNVGIIHDLAVGVDPAGADGWALQRALALGASAGAPPDPFSQLGQDWGVPPWHPRRIAEVGYAPLREMLRAVLASGGGIRMDHVMGFFRLWWVPKGSPPTHGGYVRYDAEAMVAAVTLEAFRAGAVVVGEDLGNVEPQVREAMNARGWLGSDVVWFTRDGNRYAEPGDYRASAVASISTHDLPTAAGFLTGAHIDLRASLGQLTEDEESARAGWRAERDGLLAALVREGVVEAGADLAARIEGLHEFLGRVGCALVLVSPYDVVGDLRQPNLPGTLDEYPNWRLPLSTADGAGGVRPVPLEELLDDERVRRAAATLSARARGVPLP